MERNRERGRDDDRGRGRDDDRGRGRESSRDDDRGNRDRGERDRGGRDRGDDRGSSRRGSFSYERRDSEEAKRRAEGVNDKFDVYLSRDVDLFKAEKENRIRILPPTWPKPSRAPAALMSPGRKWPRCCSS